MGVDVSICCMAKDLENYIADAIEGFLKQETTYTYEVILSDDCSTDNTLKICRDYESRYPDRIRVLSATSRLGLEENFLKTMKACTGKYIAFCDGDDYWTDALKLQKQLTYLEKNPGCTLICSDYDYINQDGFFEVSTYKLNYYAKKFNQYQDLDSAIATTLTVVIRTSAIAPLLNSITSSNHPFIWDTVLWAYVLNSGYGYFYPDKLAIRRVLSTGEYTTKKLIDQLAIGTKCLLALQEVLPNPAFQKYMDQKLYNHYANLGQALLKENQTEEARAIYMSNGLRWKGIQNIKYNLKYLYQLSKSYLHN